MKRLILSAMTVLLAAANAPAAGSYGKMYWSDNQAGCIQRANLDGTHIQSVVANAGRPWGLAIDDLNGHLYWAEGAPSLLPVIERCNLDGSDQVPLISEPWNSGAQFPQFMALDVAGGKMYYTSGNTRSIERANLDGTNPQRILIADLNGPVGIALDLRNNHIYWTHIRSTRSRICRSNLDGSGTLQLLDQQGFFYDIELDLDGGYMYWADQQPNYVAIRRANLDGSNPISIVTGIMPSGLALDLVNGKVYWSTRGTPSIQRANLDGTGVETLISRDNVPGLDYTMDVTIVRLPEPPTTPPTITGQPTNQTVAEGGTVTFSITATGTPPLTYQWQKDGLSLIAQSNATLAFAQVQPADAGGYRVIVSNTAGSVTSAVATLTVLPVPASPGSLDLSFDPTRDGSLLGLESHRGAVHALALQPDGKVIVGGEFIGVNGVPRYNLARLNAEGSLDASFHPSCSTDGRVLTVTVQPDGKVLVSGEFAFVNVAPRRHLARLYADGTLDAGFDAGISSLVGGSVYRLVLQPDGKVIIATRERGAVVGEVFGMRRLNSDGSADAGFPVRIWTNVYIGDLALQLDGKLLVGINTQPTNQPLLRLNPDGTADPTFQPQFQPQHPGWPVSVSHIALQSDGRMIVHGGFVVAVPGGGQRACYARLNADGTADASFNVGNNPPLSVKALCLQADGKLLVGLFNSGMIRLNADGSRDYGFDADSPLPGPLSVNALVLRPDGRIVVGRAYDSRYLEQLDCVYQLETSGRRDPNFFAQIHPAGAVVTAMAQQANGQLLIGGRFNHLNGQPLNGVARLNADGTWDAGLRVALKPMDWVGAVVTLPDGKALISVTTDDTNGYTIRYCVRLNGDGNVDSNFVVNVPFFSPIVLQPDGMILGIGGWPWDGEGWSKFSVVRLNSDGSLDPHFNQDGEGPSGGESSVGTVVLLPDGKILIGGEFESFNGVSRQGLARLNPDGSLDVGFDLRGWKSTWVSAIALQSDGRLVIVGAGFWANETWLGQVIRLHPDGSLDPTFNAAWANELSPNAIVVQADGKLIVAGSFRRAAGYVMNRNIVRLNADGSWDASFDDGAGANAEVNAVLLQPDGRVLIGGYFSAVNGVPRTAVALLHNVVPMTFVTRQLPSGYVPGTNFTVRLNATPLSSVGAYAVEDSPPTNLPVSSISHGGVFDARTGKVKFGPFFDHDARLLSYDLTPPLGETGAKRFAGVGSADGINTSIGGADVISIAPQQHPADNSPADNTLTISEVTAYGSAWRRGQTWPLPPNPIPIDYVTRAAALWQDGECYLFDATAASAPLWWVSCPSQAQSALLLAQPVSPSALGTARRQMPEFALPTETLTVTLEIAPSPEARACAVEETITQGLLVTNITGGGEFDAASRKIRWGPFLDCTARTVSYQVSPPAGAGFVPTTCFAGVASFDGCSVLVGAASQWPSVCCVQAGARQQDGSFPFLLRGVTGARFVIETSSDLVHWTPLLTLTNTQGCIEFNDATAAGCPMRFYRARLTE